MAYKLDLEEVPVTAWLVRADNDAVVPFKRITSTSRRSWLARSGPYIRAKYDISHNMDFNIAWKTKKGAPAVHARCIVKVHAPSRNLEPSKDGMHPKRQFRCVAEAWMDQDDATSQKLNSECYLMGKLFTSPVGLCFANVERHSSCRLDIQLEIRQTQSEIATLKEYSGSYDRHELYTHFYGPFWTFEFTVQAIDHNCRPLPALTETTDSLVDSESEISATSDFESSSSTSANETPFPAEHSVSLSASQKVILKMQNSSAIASQGSSSDSAATAKSTPPSVVNAAEISRLLKRAHEDSETSDSDGGPELGHTEKTVDQAPRIKENERKSQNRPPTKRGRTCSSSEPNADSSDEELLNTDRAALQDLEDVQSSIKAALRTKIQDRATRIQKYQDHLGASSKEFDLKCVGESDSIDTLMEKASAHGSALQDLKELVRKRTTETIAKAQKLKDVHARLGAR